MSELFSALLSKNLLDSKFIYVSRGYSAFIARKFYNDYPQYISGLIFVDGMNVNCFNSPKCDANYEKHDSQSQSYAFLQSVIPLGFTRASAHAGLSYPGPAGVCVRNLTDNYRNARSRLLSSLLNPQFWGNTLSEDSNMPKACYIASKTKGNNILIEVPVYSIVPGTSLYNRRRLDGGQNNNHNGNNNNQLKQNSCSESLTNMGGGKNKLGLPAITKDWNIPDSDHFSMICQNEYADLVSEAILDLVTFVRDNARYFESYFSLGKVTWSAANAYCTSLGGTLPMVKNDYLLNGFGNLHFDDVNDDIWLGGKGSDVNKNQFHWVDGSTVAFNNYQGNQQPNSPSSQDCLVASHVDKEWTSTQCFLHKYVVCEFNDY